ncbi:hypothetical protein [Dyadobacter sp. 3J3]|uniref:hypothetical protein n=1 Tax=Dyadobacter sp. 3J3 TaxID=2606600 RepID=UPI0013597AC9|nr:hypothetical protein [Dyadobacter sp. 3J3]
MNQPKIIPIRSIGRYKEKKETEENSRPRGRPRKELSELKNKPTPKAKDKFVQVKQIQVAKERFRWAMDILIKNGTIESVYRFCKDYGLNQGNFWSTCHLKDNPLPSIYNDFLIHDYGVSAHWLSTGEGRMFMVEYNNDVEALTGFIGA